jgi:long-chain fatty acid transport protein
MRKVLGSIALAVAVAASPAWATNGIRMIGFGPVQNSMGGASVGAGLDAAAVLTNPANMSGMPARIDFGATYFGATVEYNATDALACDPGTGAGCLVLDDTTRFTSDRGPSPIPAFGLVIPINEATTFGIGAYGIAGLGTDWAYNLAGNTVYSHYSQLRFAPGIAYKFNEMLSAGVTVNLYYSNLGYSVGSTAYGQVPHNDTSNFGIGATVGVTVKPLKNLAVGLAYESEGFHPTFKFNTPTFQFDPDGPGAAPAVIIPANTEELNFNSPQAATIGVGFRVLPNLLIAADVQWINWAGPLGDEKPEYEVSNKIPDTYPVAALQGADVTLPFDLEWEDQIVYKFGVEFAASPTFRVRAGYNYGKHPLSADKAIQNVAFPAIAEQHVTLGIGWDVTPKFTVNLGGMYSPEAEVTGTQDLTSIGYPLPVSYDVTMSQYGIDGGIAYKF